MILRSSDNNIGDLVSIDSLNLFPNLVEIHFEMSSTNMDVMAQDVTAEEQQQEPPVEATANFVPDESASIENSKKSSVKSVYWQYFSRFQEEKGWKAKCNHCKSVLRANSRNGTTNLKNNMCYDLLHEYQHNLSNSSKKPDYQTANDDDDYDVVSEVIN
ncbi:hypothetical protein Ahy_A08g038455 [Arachis hypogaea]|uniref:BED-type domain-containing protein n=1 Tax=Arachis hypogaea TaxID=3818 RepID=A0A445BTI2_ARAHY|nr:hypothetical protein Ahy_A08g038455 [Arachis hypogaea]